MITPYTLVIIGIMFEIIGAFLLALETFGKRRVMGIVKFIKQISDWSKRSLTNMFLILLPLFGLSLLGLFSNSPIIIGLTIPILILVIIQTFLIDDANEIENKLSKKSGFKQISPAGFILLLVGNIIQVVSVIWQMKIN